MLLQLLNQSLAVLVQALGATLNVRLPLHIQHMGIALSALQQPISL